jgi:predicted double-glycine peptidase
MKFNYYKQEKSYTCGAAAMRMVLEQLGIKKTEKQLVKLLKTNKVRGTWHKAFSRIAKKYALHHVEKRNAKISDLKRLQKEKYLIIVCYFISSEKIDHYAVVRKIDSKYIYFWDPFFGPKHKYLLSYFRKIWKSNPKYEKEKRWLFAVKK